ncbi:UNVERIFIED_CONTAM: DeoR family fructose operon transcriptional repressor [Brevibacillus sp. OAP136]
MLTPERHQLILSLLKEKETVHLNELVELTGASDSTVRRDLSELEEQRLLKRIHGGASLIRNKLEEPSVLEKAVKHEKEKVAIAHYAASLVGERDSIYIDAGTTTFHMLPHLPAASIVVVTNGPELALQLTKRNIKTILLGGELKAATLSLVGREAIKTISQFRFDKCFLGMNGVDTVHGLTTPDPDEAYVKQLALELSDERYVLADADKFGRVTFAKVADLRGITLITDDGIGEETEREFNRVTQLKVVKV